MPSDDYLDVIRLLGGATSDENHNGLDSRFDRVSNATIRIEFFEAKSMNKISSFSIHDVWFDSSAHSGWQQPTIPFQLAWW